LARIFSSPKASKLFLVVSGLAIFMSFILASEDKNMKNVEPFAKGQECITSKTAEEPLLFGVFTTEKDTESMKIMRQQYSSNDRNHYVMHSIRSLPEGLWLYDAFPMHKKMIIVQSLDNITDAININRQYDLDMIVYDIEHWEKTPESEQADASRSISKGILVIVHDPVSRLTHMGD
jgi:hypothetical protein